ncbi:MAG: hypothetical protein H0U23_04550 [Blastocatellia bacterium]|nr:hypothetical protein [Blastocatellia bacterium]
MVDPELAKRLAYCITWCRFHSHATVPQAQEALRAKFEGRTLSGIAIAHVLMYSRREDEGPITPELLADIDLHLRRETN